METSLPMKTIQTFNYKQKVEVVVGFYTGQSGIIIGRDYTPLFSDFEYRVQLADGQIVEIFGSCFKDGNEA